MKRYIYAMSFRKGEALRRASFYSEDLIEHIIKILLYSDIRSDDVNHWIGEIATWLRSVDSITVKPDNKHLKKKDIIDTLFQCMGDHLSDYYQSLEMFQHKNRKGQFNYDNKESYPFVEPDFESANDLMDICYQIIERTCPMISSKEDHSKEDFVEVLNQIFDHYI